MKVASIKGPVLHKGVVYALLAAALFGASTPFAKTLVGHVAGACLCWAIDNNLTRKVSASDPLQIAWIKGMVAGSANLAIALALGYSLREVRTTVLAGAVGFCG